MLLTRLWTNVKRRKGKAQPRPRVEDILGHAIPLISIVDVGAMNIGTDRYHALVERGHAQVTGFEPNPEELTRLQSRSGPYRYLPYFLGDAGPATFNATRYPGCASLLEPDPRVIDLFSALGWARPGGNFHVESSHAVETRRLDDLGP